MHDEQLTPNEKERRPTALVVSEVPDIAELVGDELRMAGFGVTEVHDGAEAFQHYCDTGFDIVVAEHYLCNMGGGRTGESHTRNLAATGAPGAESRRLEGDETPSEQLS